MKKLLALGLCLWSLAAAAQTGLAPANTVWGNNTGNTAQPGFKAWSSFVSTLPLTQYHFFIGNASNIATDTALAGDCTQTTSYGIVCTKSNNVAFGAMAFLTSTSAGDLTGTWPTVTIATGAVTSGKMAAGAAAANVGTLGGDLSGTLPNPTVTKVQGLAYKSAATYSGGQVPTWSSLNSDFEPGTPASGAADYNIVTQGGAKCDYRVVGDGAMGSGSTTLTSATAAFTAGDVGKYIAVQGAGAAGVTLFTTVASFTNSTTVVLTVGNTSGGAISSKLVELGTDDTTAINNSIVAALAAKENVYVPPGKCLASRINLTSASNLIFHGAGMGLSQIFPKNDASYGTATGHLFDMTGASYVQVRDLQIGAFNELAKPTTAFFQAQINSGACNVQTLGPNLYVTGSFTYDTVYNYGCPSSTYKYAQIYNYANPAQGVVNLSATNSGLLSSSFATVAAGTQSTSDIVFIKTEIHNFSGQNAAQTVVNLDHATNISWFGGNITGGAQYYVVVINASHISFFNTTWETESQPTPAYVFAAGSGAGTISDISTIGGSFIFATSVYNWTATATNLTTQSN